MDTLTSPTRAAMNHVAEPHVANAHEALATRERVVRALLPYDFSYAHDAGLLDMYDIDPVTGNDGLLHTLIGQTYTDARGVVHALGYHHEPSGELVSDRYITEDGQELLDTRVDKQHINEGNGAHRKKYADRPLEPYSARVIVGGLHKMAVKKQTDGGVGLVPVTNSMFPKEYDALGVLQAIRIAYTGLDIENDKLMTDADGTQLVVNEGVAPLMDGTSTMRIRIVMRPGDRKIVTAIPIVNNKGIMRLTHEQADQLVWDQAG